MAQKVPVPGPNTFEKFKTRPLFVKVTTDTERRRNWLEFTFEYKGELLEFANFLYAIRDDLWNHGFWTREITLMQSGLSGVAIEPTIDPTLTGCAVFRVRLRDEEASDEKFLRGMRDTLLLESLDQKAGR